MQNTKINLEEVNTILADTLKKLIDKDLSHKQAGMIAKIASTLSRNIINTELSDRVELLEQLLKRRK